jgi:hypothetical protein
MSDVFGGTASMMKIFRVCGVPCKGDKPLGDNGLPKAAPKKTSLEENMSQLVAVLANAQTPIPASNSRPTPGSEKLSSTVYSFNFTKEPWVFSFIVKDKEISDSMTVSDLVKKMGNDDGNMKAVFLYTQDEKTSIDSKIAVQQFKIDEATYSRATFQAMKVRDLLAVHPSPVNVRVQVAPIPAVESLVGEIF